MLAALLCNLGGGGPPPPAVVANFGGGPFFRRYGYGSAYDAIREAEGSTSSAFEIPEPLVVVRKAVPINYSAVGSRVSSDVVDDMRDLLKTARDDDELMQILLMFDS